MYTETQRLDWLIENMSVKSLDWWSRLHTEIVAAEDGREVIDSVMQGETVIPDTEAHSKEDDQVVRDEAEATKRSRK